MFSPPRKGFKSFFQSWFVPIRNLCPIHRAKGANVDEHWPGSQAGNGGKTEMKKKSAHPQHKIANFQFSIFTWIAKWQGGTVWDSEQSQVDDMKSTVFDGGHREKVQVNQGTWIVSVADFTRIANNYFWKNQIFCQHALVNPAEIPINVVQPFACFVVLCL